ncbi:hypothetical protein ABKN59_007757 [Abortiporus biennis]
MIFTPTTSTTSTQHSNFRMENNILQHSIDSKSPIHIPQELVEEILNHLHDDKATLSECSLVCADWVEPSRRHLFQSVEVFIYTIFQSQYRNSNGFHEFSSFLKRNPALARFIREIRLIGHKAPATSSAQGRPLCNGNIIILILTDLPQLQVLQFKNLSIAIDAPDLIHPPQLRKVSELFLTNISFTFRECGNGQTPQPRVRYINSSSPWYDVVTPTLKDFHCLSVERTQLLGSASTYSTLRLMLNRTVSTFGKHLMSLCVDVAILSGQDIFQSSSPTSVHLSWSYVRHNETFHWHSDSSFQYNFNTATCRGHILGTESSRTLIEANDRQDTLIYVRRELSLPANVDLHIEFAPWASVSWIRSNEVFTLRH